jgi:hypothetical protein
VRPAKNGERLRFAVERAPLVVGASHVTDQTVPVSAFPQRDPKSFGLKPRMTMERTSLLSIALN